MLQVDDFMKFLILHCFYHYFLNHHFMVQIHRFMELLIFRWFYHHHWMVQDMIFMTFFLLNLPISQGALWGPQGPPATPQGPPKAPPRTTQGSPMGSLRVPSKKKNRCPAYVVPPGDPNLQKASQGPAPSTQVNLWQIMKFYVDLADCHQIISKILFV